MSANNRKKDSDAPRGVFRRGRHWAIRYRCGRTCTHEETVGAKGDAIRTHAQRRAKALGDPSWCPKVERGRVRDARRRSKVTFGSYAADYGKWAAQNKRGWMKSERFMVAKLTALLGAERPLQAIATKDIEAVRDRLRGVVSPATTNRYRDLLSGMFRRAERLGLVSSNPCRGVPKFRESAGRITYIGPTEEAAIAETLSGRLKLAFVVAVNTGLRWSEQSRLTWKDVDLLGGTVTVLPGKTTTGRGIPLNAAAQRALVDLASQRLRPDDPTEQLFPLSYRQTAILFARAVERAKEALRDAGISPAGLDAVSWHSARHTFASRLVLSGADLRTVQELGGWRTLALVARYSHLNPTHLRAAVERIGGSVVPEAGQKLDSGSHVVEAEVR